MQLAQAIARMASTPPNNRRRTSSLLQNRRAQLLNAFLIVNYLIVYTVALSAVSLGPTVVSLLQAPRTFVEDPGRATAAATELLLFESRVWPFAILLIALFGLHSIAISHRVFGPLAQVRSLAQRVAAGDLKTRARFRKNDHLEELSESLNTMLVALDAQVGEVQAAHAEALRRLEELHRAQFASASDRMQAFEALRDELLRLHGALDTFQTTSTEVRDPNPHAGSAATSEDACPRNDPSPQSATA
jgi:methyl-accepting chemotaxis protein